MTVGQSDVRPKGGPSLGRTEKVNMTTSELDLETYLYTDSDSGHSDDVCTVTIEDKGSSSQYRGVLIPGVIDTGSDIYARRPR